jgi:hypothetical protein
MFRLSQPAESSTSKLQQQLDRELHEQSRRDLLETVEAVVGSVVPVLFDLKLGLRNKPQQQEFWN